METVKNRGLAKKFGVAGLLALAGIALTGCEVTPPSSMSKLLDMGFPDPVTPEAHSMYNFWVWVWLAAWIIGIIMWAIFIYAIFAWNGKRREKKGYGEFPKQLQYNVPLELGLTIVPIIIVMVLFFYTVQAQTKVVALDKNPEVTVDVTAYQWNWKFGYAQVGSSLSPTGSDYDGQDVERQKLADESKFDDESIPNANPIHGHSMSDQSFLRYNLIETIGTTEEIPVLVLPTETPVEFRLASGDVSHSFWVPEFLFKRDAYVHPEINQQQRSFQIEQIEKPGAYVGRCAEMCGTYHAMMNFEIRAVTPDQFREYMRFRNENPEASNADALEAIGEAPYATSTRPFNSDRTGTRDGNNAVQNV